MLRKFTLQEYFLFERASPAKNEYYRGEILAMPGASSNHNIITGRIHTFLNLCAEEKENCVAYSNDMMLYAPNCPLSAYPDLMVCCGEPEYLAGQEEYVLLNPILVGEVLSDSTEEYDRTVKLPCFLTIPSVQTVIIAAQKEKRIEVYRKTKGNSTVEVYTQGIFSIMDCEMEVERIYKNVKF